MNGELSKLFKPPVLGPIDFDPMQLPEVVELQGEDGQRQWALAQHLAERGAPGFESTVPGELRS